MRQRPTIAALAGAAILIGGTAFAQMQPGTMQPGTMQHGAGHGAGMPGARATADTPSTKAYKAVAMKMHKDMAIAYTGDADVDFVKGMIPHHQAAIDMAKIQLQYGKDAETRTLAQAVITAQEAEIAQMQAWLKAKGQ